MLAWWSVGSSCSDELSGVAVRVIEMENVMSGVVDASVDAGLREIFRVGMGADASRPILCAVSFDFDDGVTLYATDSFRLFQRKLCVSGADASALREAFGERVAFDVSQLKVSQLNKASRFVVTRDELTLVDDCNERVAVLPVLDAVPPNRGVLFPADAVHRVSFSRDDLLRQLDRVLVAKVRPTVSLLIDDDCLLLDVARLVEIYQLDDSFVNVNIGFLRGALKLFSRGARLEVSWRDCCKPFVISEYGCGSSDALLMPVALREVFSGVRIDSGKG